MPDFFKVIRSYLLEYLPNQRSYSENTIISYRQALNLLVSFLTTVKSRAVKDISFTIINKELILDFLDWLETERNCGAVSRNQRLMALRSFFKYAGKLDCTRIALSLEIADIPIKREDGKVVDFLSETSLQALLAQPNQSKPKEMRDLFFMVLMYDTAARCSEMLDLRIRDLRVDVQHPIIYLHGKWDKTRTVPLLPRTVEHYKKFLALFHKGEIHNSDKFLFYTVIHGIRHQLSADAVALFLKKYAITAGKTCPEITKNLHPHMLRHTRSIHLYRSGMPLNLLGEFLGHSDLKSTRIYAYADSEMKRDAISKADAIRGNFPPPSAIWENDEQMILKLSGLS